MSGDIVCQGWVLRGEAREWSRDAITFSDQISIPSPSPTEVRVRVRAVGVNPHDWRQSPAKGPLPSDRKRPALKLLHHPPEPCRYPSVIGVDGAGEIESIGSSVNDLKVGDRVVFYADTASRPGGSYSEYAVVQANAVVQIPDKNISFDEAAAMPCAAWTAYVALFDKLRVEKGRSIFIDGASGGVGTAAVQLAHHFGLVVFASCSPESAEYVRGLGADVVLDYNTKEKMIDIIMKETNENGVDYYLPVSSASQAEVYADALRFGGSLCAVSGLVTPVTDALFRRQVSIHYVCLAGLHRHGLTQPQLRYIGDSVMKLYIAGAFRQYIEVLPLKGATDALDRLATGTGTRGKLVLKLP